jgi:hypothetical protein
METYSRDLQDVFVYSITNKKESGSYVEIGAGDPIKGSNTYLLEKNFNWIGISIEIDSNLCQLFKQKRKNEIICNDATIVNYNELIKKANLPTEIDYLQVDCEPALTTLNALKKIPLEIYKFSVITFEHDNYNYSVQNENYHVRLLSREYLSKFGYVMIANDICCKNKKDKRFEDWWIYPELIDSEMIKKFIATNGINKNVEDYVLPRIRS